MTPYGDAAEPQGSGGTRPSAAGVLRSVSASLGEDPEAERIRVTTAGLIAQMEDVAREAGITPEEPIAPVMAALGRTVAWMGEMAAVSAQLARKVPAILEAARDAADAEVQRKNAAIAANTAEMAQQLARDVAEAIRVGDAKRTVVYRRNSLLATAGAAALALVVMCGGSYLLGRSDGQRHAQQVAEAITAMMRRNPASTDAWATLMASNDPMEFLPACRDAALKVIDGRRACSAPIWLDPPRLAAPPRR